MRNVHFALTCALALGSIALLQCGCDNGQAEQIAALEKARTKAEDEAQEWRGKYEDLINRQEVLQVKIVGANNRNEALQKELDSLKAQVERLTTNLHLAATPPPATPEAGTQPSQPAHSSQGTLSDLLQQLEGLGQALFVKEEYATAAAVLNIAVHAGADSPSTYCQLADSEARLGDYEAAVSDYEAALKALGPPKDEDTAIRLGCLTNYGAALQRLGRHQEAEQAYRDALSVEPDYAPVHFNLGLLYATELKRPIDAIDHLRRHIVQGGTRSESARQIIQELQELAAPVQ